MEEEKLRLRRVRILVTVMAVHLIAIPVFVYESLRRFEEPAWKAQTELAQSLAREIRDQLAIRQMAFGDNANQLQKTTVELADRYGLAGLRVYDAFGNLRSWSGEATPEKISFSDTKTTQVKSTENFLHVTSVVSNKPACFSCHEPSQKIIGVLQASIPITAFYDQLRDQRKRAAILTFLLLAFVFSLVFIFHHSFVVLPIKRMLAALARVKGGDLSVQIPIRRKDEMGAIAESLNQVVRSLKEARAELEKRHQTEMFRAEQLASVGEIAAGLAHEIKNPLAGITSALEVVLDESTLSSSDREILQQILVEDRRIAAIINDLLLYARPRKLQPDWCEVRIMLSDIQRIFSPQCQQRGVSFSLNVPEELGRIFVDSQEMRQILMNILRNALEALTEGGNISLSAYRSNLQIVFLIQDDGPGMEEEVRTHIFQPFFTTKPNGTGLGLSIVLSAVQEMQGKIRVDSGPGKGTRFEISIPQEPQDEVVNR